MAPRSSRARKPGPKRSLKGMGLGIVKASKESLEKYERIAKEFVWEHKALPDLFEREGWSRKQGDKGLEYLRHNRPALHSMIMSELTARDKGVAALYKARAAVWKQAGLSGEDLDALWQERVVSGVVAGNDDGVQMAKLLGQHRGLIGEEGGVTVNLGEMPEGMRERFERFRASLPQPPSVELGPSTVDDEAPDRADKTLAENPSPNTNGGGDT